MRQRSPGSWQLRAYTGRDANGRPVQVTRTVRGTKREAQLALAKLVVDAGAGQATLPTTATVDDL